MASKCNSYLKDKLHKTETNKTNVGRDLRTKFIFNQSIISRKGYPAQGKQREKNIFFLL